MAVCRSGHPVLRPAVRGWHTPTSSEWWPNLGIPRNPEPLEVPPMFSTAMLADSITIGGGLIVLLVVILLVVLIVRRL